MPYVLGASLPITTVTTPSSASAPDTSMLLILACGYGECRILPMSMPDMVRSSAYLPWPVVLPAESTRAMGLPMTEKLVTYFSPRRHGGPEKFSLGYRQSLLLGLNRRFDGLIHLGVAGASAQV